jgi:8-amino-7-oxononanoate synthase
VLDFTSSLYLGFDHRACDGSGEPLTLGKPAALEEPPGAEELGRSLAALVGCQSAVLAPSTLHLFWDLCEGLGRNGATFCADRGVYRVSRMGLETAAAKGAQVLWFSHHDPDSLARQLTRARGRPVVITDGFCPACGVPAPLGRYLEAVRRYGGLLVLDDTQALGILGFRESGRGPYGTGGGGSLAFHSLAGDDIILVSSLAKAFGAPLAMLGAGSRLVSDFAADSATRVHCSPPSTAAIRAGARAVVLNRWRGDGLRLRLGSLIRGFRQRLAVSGWRVAGGYFPVQTVLCRGVAHAHETLLRLGIQTVPQKAGLSFVLTARHTQSEVEQAARALCSIGSRLTGGNDEQLTVRTGNIRVRV